MLLVAGCTAQVHQNLDPDLAAVLVQNGACSALEGASFASVAQGECGLGPDGVSQCTWHITFDSRDGTASEYSWRHSDVEEAARVECHGRTLTGYTFDGQARYSGDYDPLQRTLTWEAMVYVPQ